MLRQELTGTEEADTILGGGGGDFLHGHADDNTIQGGNGNDRIGIDRFYGNGHDDTMFGDASAD